MRDDQICDGAEAAIALGSATGDSLRSRRREALGLFTALAVLLFGAAPAEGDSLRAAERMFTCKGDGRNVVRVEALDSGAVLLRIGTELQAVPLSAYASMVGDMEASIADWHAGAYIPRRLRSIVTGLVPVAPPCRGRRPIPDCRPSSDTSDYLWSGHHNGFLLTRLTLMSGCNERACRQEEAVWRQIETLEAAAVCLARAIPGWQPRPRPNGGGQGRETGPIKPQK